MHQLINFNQHVNLTHQPTRQYISQPNCRFNTPTDY